MTISSLIDDFLQNLKSEKRSSRLTMRNYSHWLKEFLSFTGDIDPKDINLDLARRYKMHLAKKHLKKVTQNYFLIALRSLLRYLVSLRIDSLSFKEINLSQTQSPPQQVLDDSQLQQLLQAPDTSKKKGLRDRAILETLYATGAKVSQVVNLNRRDASSVWVEKYLRARKDSFKPLFIRFQGKVNPANAGEAMRLTARSIERIVEKYVKKTGLSLKATPEILRRASA